ncbi:MAG: family 10 glycosylhydrolase [Myxococcales bacterium]|nr:family 10 glycosylhydrolase [Myxococcales bacterium]
MRGAGILITALAATASWAPAAGCVASQPTAPPLDGDKRLDLAPGLISGEFVAATHERQLRAAWVATVWGLDYPRDASATAAAKEAELRALIGALADRGFNAVFLQVRAEADALYASELEPWARVLTGTQDAAPGFDPLAVAIDEAHRRGIELHAWLNPYRARISGVTQTAATHIVNTHPELVVSYGSQRWLNPGKPQVRAHVLAVIADLTARYDIDGVHFDDYFYPYPVAGQTFDDTATYNEYLAAGGTLGLGDWRRDNVNLLVRGVADQLAASAPHVRFGISPFGIYRPGIPEGITGLDAYDAIYADAPTWITEGWVDYLAPQLYWPTTQTAQSYATLLPWWASLAGDSGRFVVAGINAAAYATTPAWDLTEMQTQLALADNNISPGVRGAIAYSATKVTGNQDLGNLFATAWVEPALPPPVVADAAVPGVPTFEFDDEARRLTIAGMGRFVLYQYIGTSWTVREVMAGPQTRVLGEGSFAVTAVGENARESSAVVITAVSPVQQTP